MSYEALALDQARPPHLVIIGSSVAEGYSATYLGPEGGSWAGHLARALRLRGWGCTNAAIAGTTVDAWLEIFSTVLDGDVLTHARCCLLSLSLANEGLTGLPGGCREAEMLCEAYAERLQGLVQQLRVHLPATCRLVVAGPYPNDDYSPGHVPALRQVTATVRTWPEVDHVVDVKFLQPGSVLSLNCC